MGGNLESARAAEGEALVRDGEEELKERTGGPGSNALHNSFCSQPTCFMSSVFPLVDHFYIR